MRRREAAASTRSIAYVGRGSGRRCSGPTDVAAAISALSLDAHAVRWTLVALAQARAGSRSRRRPTARFDHHRLEAPAERPASFSTYLQVLVERGVAPAALLASSYASIGFSRLAASTAPSAAPAPTMCQLVQEQDPTLPWASETCAEHGLQGDPRTLPGTSRPAIREPMSSAITRRSRSGSGMSAGGDPLGETLDDRGLAERRARRSARGCSWCAAKAPGSRGRISSSRPITGSSLPCSAAWVRSVPKRSSASYLASSGFWSR